MFSDLTGYIFIALLIVLHVVCFFQYDSSIFLNINTQLTLFVWLFSILLSKNHKVFLALPLVLLVVNELCYKYFNLDIFSGPSRTALFYDLTTTYFIKNGKNNTNLTEGLYLKNLEDITTVMTEEECKQLSPVEANQNKYKKLFLDLKIPKEKYGEIRLLDIGCGNGDFIKYCKSIGIQASGLTISKNQVKELKDHDVHHGSYRELQKQFIGKYDIITTWGCLEHITDSYPCSKEGEKKAKRILHKMMEYFKQYYKTDSPYKYFFNTTLHIKPNTNGWEAYFMERAYAGWYFYDAPNETIGELIKEDGFTPLYSEDMTYHYYMATKIDPTHFGTPRNTTFYQILCTAAGLFINPQISAMMIYTLNGLWMWQFDGKTHTNENCNDCTLEERSKRPTTLIWSLHKLNTKDFCIVSP